MDLSFFVFKTITRSPATGGAVFLIHLRIRIGVMEGQA